MGQAFSPLDEALGLHGGGYSPHLLSWLVRLGAEVPFPRAAFWLEALTGVVVSATTVRRYTEAVGATAVALSEAEVAQLEREAPPPSTQPERVVMGADGAMVPLVGGEWAEVKLLSVGVPTPAGAPGHTRQGAVSYFARLADADTFSTQVLVELHRRGVAVAGAVAAVQDGAPWLQGLVDLHRPDATRILDWPHAAEHLTQVAEAVFGVASARARRVSERLRRWLWEEGPDRVLAVLAGWERARPTQPGLATAVAYVRDRQAQLAYPTFRAAGWPVGSGATESGHKQVMQARMKRAGMRWGRLHVNPVLALSLLAHNDRWDAEGPRLLAQHRHQALQRRRAQRHQRRPCREDVLDAPPPVASASPPVAPLHAPAGLRDRERPASPFRHPWRRYGTPLSAKI